MGIGPFATNIAATNAGTTEATIATTPTMSAVAANGPGYLVKCNVEFTGNATASTTTFKIYRNSTSGTLVYTSPAYNVAAAAVVQRFFAFLDRGATAGGVTNYVITQTNSGAAGNSGTIGGCVSVWDAEGPF